MDGTTAFVIIVLALIVASAFEAWVKRNKPDGGDDE